MTTTPETPTTVEPRQVWRDNDPRSKGAGEFVVRAVVLQNANDIDSSMDVERWNRADDWCWKARRAGLAGQVAIVERAYGHFSRIRIDRLLNHAHRKNGYTYLGRSR